MMCFLKRRWGLVALGVTLGLVLAVSAAQAGKITLGSPVVAADGGLDVSVNVAPDSGQNVAALQFDLHYDSSQYGFADAISGGAATGAGKDAVVSETEPGTVRVVVAGINQDSFGSGTVATLHFERMDKTASSPSFSNSTTLDEVVASGPSGESIEGLDVSANLSESTAATTTESNTKTSSTGTSATLQNNTGRISADLGATGFSPALESGREEMGAAGRRSTAAMGASVASHDPAQGNQNAVTPAVPLVSSGAPSRRVLENSTPGSVSRMVNSASLPKGQVDQRSPESAGTPSALAARKTLVAENSSGVSPLGPSKSNSAQTLAARTGSSSPFHPATAVSPRADGTLKINEPSNSGILILIVGSIAALALMFGAWAFRRS